MVGNQKCLFEDLTQRLVLAVYNAVVAVDIGPWTKGVR